MTWDDRLRWIEIAPEECGSWVLVVQYLSELFDSKDCEAVFQMAEDLFDSEINEQMPSTLANDEEIESYLDGVMPFDPWFLDRVNHQYDEAFARGELSSSWSKQHWIAAGMLF